MCKELKKTPRKYSDARHDLKLREQRENKYQDEAEKNVEISQWLSDSSKKDDLSFPLMSVGTTTRKEIFPQKNRVNGIRDWPLFRAVHLQVTCWTFGQWKIYKIQWMMMLTGILGVGSVCVAPYFPYKKVLHMHCYHVMIEKFSQKQSLILRCQTWLELPYCRLHW